MAGTLRCFASSAAVVGWIAVVLAAVRPGYGQADPDPGRFLSEIEAFEAGDLLDVVPRNAVLFVGSSSIRLWPTAVYFPDLPVVNRGFGGSHISDVNFFFDRVVSKYAPRAIVFYAGDNDIADGKSAERVLGDYQAFVGRVHAQAPTTEIFFVSIKPSLARWTLWPEMRRANELVAGYSATSPHVHMIDVAASMLGIDGKPRTELFLEDGLHLNRAGYDLWAQHTRVRLLHAWRGDRDARSRRP
jgi:hypothetical protein